MSFPLLRSMMVLRRQVTVMFWDLVGSTALSAPDGPAGPSRSHFGDQKCVAEIVRRLGAALTCAARNLRLSRRLKR
jgi:class 3 adenylate cyclase